MADATVVVQDATGVNRPVDNETVDRGGEDVYRQRVVVVPDATGTWSYEAGTGGGTVNVTGRLLSVRAFANGTDGTFTVNGGANITVRSDTGVDWTPATDITDPTLVFSASIDFFVEVLA